MLGMPKRKPQSDLSITEDEPLVIYGSSIVDEKQPRGKHRPSIRIPVNEEGVIDMTRLKDPQVLERARVALGMPAEMAAAPAPEFKLPEPVLKAIPLLYDGLALGARAGMNALKWPRQLTTPEQRAEFYQFVRYSDEFKERATEPTAKVLTKVVGNSKLARWFIEHSDVGEFAALLLMGTWEMVQNAATQFNTLQQAKAARAGETKPNGGFTASENRPAPGSPGYEGATEQ